MGEEKSALYTFPNLRNFRVAVLRDFRRVFAHVAPVFLDRGIANVKTKVHLTTFILSYNDSPSLCQSAFLVSFSTWSLFLKELQTICMEEVTLVKWLLPQCEIHFILFHLSVWLPPFDCFGTEYVTLKALHISLYS